MTTTPNYGFNIPEGSDTVNLLTQNYPNFTNLDSILKTIEDTGITTAVATKVGTVFQIVRTNTDLAVMRFIATANYAAGDTFTVDGVAVTATAMNGTALPAGAFVINQSVEAILNGSVLTIVGVAGITSIDAQDVTYDNTVSGLAATNVQNAIDEVKGDIPTGFAATAITYDNSGSGLTAADVQAAIDELAARNGSVSVTADGVKTKKQLLNQLFSLIDHSKINGRTYLYDSDFKCYCNLSRIPATQDYIMSSGYWIGSELNVTIRLRNGDSSWCQNGIDYGSQVPTLGVEYTLYY